MIRQFDLVENPSRHSRSLYPFLVVLQSHHLDASHLTVVAPVLPRTAPAVTLTSVAFDFQDRQYYLLVGELTSIDANLVRSAVGSVRSHEDAIRRALERVFSGF